MAKTMRQNLIARLVALKVKGFGKARARHLLDHEGYQTDDGETDLKALSRLELHVMEAVLAGLGVKNVDQEKATKVRNCIADFRDGLLGASMTYTADGIMPGTSAPSETPTATPTPSDDDFGFGDDLLAAFADTVTLCCKPGDITVALDAYLMASLGLEDAPARAMDLIDARLDRASGEGYPAVHKRLEQWLLRRDQQAAVTFKAMGTEGYVSPEDRQLFQVNMSSVLTAFQAYHQQVIGWSQAQTAAMANPAMFMSILGGGTGGAGRLAAGIASNIDITPLQTSALTLFEAINRAFAGRGKDVIAMVAKDLRQLQKDLLGSELKGAIGARDNREVLRLLNIRVTEDVVQGRKSMRTFVKSAISIREAGSSDEGIDDAIKLYQSGAAIPWAAFGGVHRGASTGHTPSYVIRPPRDDFGSVDFGGGDPIRDGGQSRGIDPWNDPKRR